MTEINFPAWQYVFLGSAPATTEKKDSLGHATPVPHQLDFLEICVDSKMSSPPYRIRDVASLLVQHRQSAFLEEAAMRFSSITHTFTNMAFVCSRNDLKQDTTGDGNQFPGLATFFLRECANYYSEERFSGPRHPGTPSIGFS